MPDAPFPSRPTLGVVAIARNERRDIEGFVEHLVSWVDEIVVVDDGSDDGTLEYLEARGPPVRVVRRRLEPRGGFAAQRNAGLEAARSDWLLHMDIDERVTPELAREIRAAILGAQQNAFRYRRLNFFLHRPFEAGGWETWNAPHLARRGGHRFVNAIHEQAKVDGGEAATGQLAARMWHLNDETFVERVEKNIRYSQFSAQEILETGRRIRWFDLVLKPFWRAFKAYVLRGAWRYGELGLVFAIYTYSGTFNHLAIAWDAQNRRAREALEADLQALWRKSQDRHG